MLRLFRCLARHEFIVNYRVQRVLGQRLGNFASALMMALAFRLVPKR